MSDDFTLDRRRLKFLDAPKSYIRQASGFELAPLTRQFRTAQAILRRLLEGQQGVLLADDVGLGKTTAAALVAWTVATQGGRVRIYAPNGVLRRRWAEELERHTGPLSHLGARNEHIRQGVVPKLHGGRIQVATHHELVRSQRDNEQRTACDLMIVDEAHRAKGEGTAFNQALRAQGFRAKRLLILTATPFSIRLEELKQLLAFVEAGSCDAVDRYAADLVRLYGLGPGHDADKEAKRLEQSASAAIAQLQPYVIRHGVDDLSSDERKHFGTVDSSPWRINPRSVDSEELELLLRMDRLLKLTAERSGERRNDPRFHIGWRQVGTALDIASQRANDSDPVVHRHYENARSLLEARRRTRHPKIEAVSNAIAPVLAAGEKVLVFCHHRAAAAELLEALEELHTLGDGWSDTVPAVTWRAAWRSLSLHKDAGLLAPILDWLCSPGIRRQVGNWLGAPKTDTAGLTRQLQGTKPRGATAADVPSIAEAARALVEALLDEQSMSTRALLVSMAGGQRGFGGRAAHFPGRLDEGHRVMGSWLPEPGATPARTLYSGKPDIVLALFNSPFGPDVLVVTDRLSEGVDLHRSCRHLIHYELDPSPVRTIQRNGRIRRVGSWAAKTGKPIRYAYPAFGGTRDEKAVLVMKQRLGVFGLLLGGVPTPDDDVDAEEQRFADKVIGKAARKLSELNAKLCAVGAEKLS